MQLPVVELEAWLSLETAIAHRYRNTPWRPKAIMRGLLRFAGWRIPTAEEAYEQTGGLSRSALSRRRQLARAELPMMATLPKLTPLEDLFALEHRKAFGFPVEIVRPADRVLNF